MGSTTGDDGGGSLGVAAEGSVLGADEAGDCDGGCDEGCEGAGEGVAVGDSAEGDVGTRPDCD